MATTNVKNLSISAQQAASEAANEDAVEATKPADEVDTPERLVDKAAKVEGNPEKKSVDRASERLVDTESGQRDEIRPEREDNEEARADGRLVVVVEGKLQQVETEEEKLETAVVKRREEVCVRRSSRSRK